MGFADSNPDPSTSTAQPHLDPRGRQVSIDPTFPPAHPPLLDTYADALDPQAIRHYQQSLTLRRQVGDLWGQGATLNYLGLVLDRLGRYTEALDHYRQALTLRREVGDQRGEGATLTCAGMTYERLERYAEAAAHHKQALALMRTTGDKQGEGAALGNLGNIYRRMARYDEALAHHQQTLTAMREVGDRNSESEVLNDLGETYLAMGQIDDALGQHRHALALARDVHVRPQAARAHNGIAHALNSTDPDAARQHWLQALDIYRALGVPEADQVRRYLETSAATTATAASTWRPGA